MNIPDEVAATEGHVPGGVCFRIGASHERREARSPSTSLHLRAQLHDDSTPPHERARDPVLCPSNQTSSQCLPVCVVDVGARVYPAACIRECEPGMKVKTDAPGVVAARATLVEMLMSDHPTPCARQEHSGDCELETMAKAAGVSQPRFARRLSPRGRDDSSLSIAVDHEACILCDRCIRGCDDVKKNMVIGRSGRGYTAHVGFDLDLPMGSSTCVSCGECMVSCPTGALTNKRVVDAPWKARARSAWILRLRSAKVGAGTFLELNRSSVVKRSIKPGDIICREGEFGSRRSTSSGTVEGLHHSRGSLHRTRGRSAVSAKIRSKCRSPATQARRRELAPVHPDLPRRSAVRQADRGARRGDLFGNDLMRFHPRSATVRAKTELLSRDAPQTSSNPQNNKTSARLRRSPSATWIAHPQAGFRDRPPVSSDTFATASTDRFSHAR